MSMRVKSIEPMNDQTLVKMIEPEDEVLDSGFIIPGGLKGGKNNLEIRTSQAEVIATGDGKVDRDGKKHAFPFPDLKPGDRILVDDYAARDLVVNSVKYKVVDPEGILSKLYLEENPEPKKVKKVENSKENSQWKRKQTYRYGKSA